MVVVFREEVGEMLFGSLISHVGDGGRRGLNTERIVWSESDGLLSLSMACVPFCAEGRASEIARPFRDLLEPFRDLLASSENRRSLNPSKNRVSEKAHFWYVSSELEVEGLM